MKNKRKVKRNDQGFGYLKFVSGPHDRTKTRVWVHNLLIKKENDEEFVDFPIQNAIIDQTQKGSLVMRPHSGGCNIFLVELPSGYRGNSVIKNIFCGPGCLEAWGVANGQTYHSELGNLGETAWAIVNADGPIDVFARVTGRSIDQEDIAFRLIPDGSQEELILDQEIHNLLK
jgi:hypothetical protein